MESWGRTLVVLGVLMSLLGAGLWLVSRSGGGFLPGDIVVEKKNVKFYFPLMTCLAVSIVLSVIAWLIRR